MNRLVINTYKVDQWLFHFQSAKSIVIALQQTVPILAVNIYLHLLYRLTISPDSLMSYFFNHPLHVAPPIVENIRFGLSLLDGLVIMIFVAGFTFNYLSSQLIHDTSLPILTNFLITYLILSSNNQFSTTNTSQYLLITIFVYFSVKSYTYQRTHFLKNTVSPYDLRNLLWSGMIIGLTVISYHYIGNLHFQSNFSTLLSKNLFSSFTGLLLIAVLSPLMFIIGFPLPSELTDDQTTLNTVISNLDAFLNSTHTNLPFPENLYSTYGSYTLFGGIGNTIIISFLLLFMKNERYKRLGRIAWLPSLFDNNYLLYSGLPMFFRPILIVPSLLVSTLSLLISYVAIALHFVKPVIFITPTHLPNLLLPTIASGTPIRSTILTIIILIMSYIIYKPFVMKLTSEEN